jgi:hypothetical protein
MGIVDALCGRDKDSLPKRCPGCCGLLVGHGTCARKTCVPVVRLRSFAGSAARVAVGQALYCPHRLAPG